MTDPAPATQRLVKILALAVLVLSALFITSVIVGYAVASSISEKASKASEKAKTASDDAKAASKAAQAAAKKAQHSVDCVNDVLASRAATTQRDSLAHIAFAEAANRILTAPQARQAAEFIRFVAATKTYVATLTADQAEREAHPLGHC